MPSIILVNSLSIFAAIFYNVGHEVTLPTFILKHPLKMDCGADYVGFH